MVPGTWFISSKSSFLFSSVQFSHSVMSESLQPHKPQHSRPPCPSPTPGVYPGLISFRMDWLDLLAVQGILKSILQHHSSKASILHSTFFTVQLSHPYMTTGKTIALTRRTFVDKVMSLLFNMVSRLAITFLPRTNTFSNGIPDPGIKPGSPVLQVDSLLTKLSGKGKA